MKNQSPKRGVLVTTSFLRYSLVWHFSLFKTTFTSFARFFFWRCHWGSWLNMQISEECWIIWSSYFIQPEGFLTSPTIWRGKIMIKHQQLKFTRRFISASSMLTITSVDRCATDLIISKHTLPVLAAIWNYTKLKTLSFQANTEKIYPSQKLTPRSLISECMMIKNWVLL